MSIEKAIQWSEENFHQSIAQLSELVKIPSVSFDGYDPQEVVKSAQLVSQLMVEAGLADVQILELPGTHPYVFGQYHFSDDAPTILLYAHHDVQPPMREELWESPPFEPTKRNGRLYGRGTADDKAGIIIHLQSIAAYLKTQTPLEVNLKVIIEGEEETGSENLPEFLTQYKDLLQADYMVLADLANYDTGIPTITTSLRGMLVAEVEVQVMEHALHSGLWSGPIPDPAMGLTKLLSSLTDEQNQIIIPGFLDDLIPLSETELASYTQLDMNTQTLAQQANIHPGVELPQTGEAILQALWRQPSLVINSMEVAQRASAGNVLMDGAWARFGIRLAPGMDADKCQKLLEDYLQAKTPWGLKLKIKSEPPVNPWYSNPEHPVFQAAAQAMSQAYQKETVFIGCGASIPFVEPMSQALGGIPSILIGVEDPYCRAHGENESLNLEDFRKAIQAQVRFYHEVAQLSKTS